MNDHSDFADLRAILNYADGNVQQLQRIDTCGGNHNIIFNRT